MKQTKKVYREYLNDFVGYDFNKQGNGKYAARTRKYGDYIYSQDKEMFNEGYQRWLKEQSL